MRLDPVRINDANVIQADILATNGVIHALDKVLIPCADDAAWHKKNEPAKDCAWVSQWAPRCNVKGEDNIRVVDAHGVEAGENLAALQRLGLEVVREIR